MIKPMVTGGFSDGAAVKPVAQSPLSRLILGQLSTWQQTEREPTFQGLHVWLMEQLKGWLPPVNSSKKKKKAWGDLKWEQGRLEVKAPSLFPHDQEEESEHKAV